MKTNKTCRMVAMGFAVVMLALAVVNAVAGNLYACLACTTAASMLAAS